MEKFFNVLENFNRKKNKLMRFSNQKEYSKIKCKIKHHNNYASEFQSMFQQLKVSFYHHVNMHF